MKTFTLLFLSFIMLKGCSQEDKKDLSNTTIEYTATTRGFFQKITIKDKQATISSQRDNPDEGKVITITTDEWNGLIEEFKTINLDAIGTYVGPTQKRFHDGAAFASMTITYKDSVYNSAAFDHGFPPKEIEKLVNKVVAFGKNK